MSQTEIDERLERWEKELDTLRAQVEQQAGLPADARVRFEMLRREFHELIGEPLTLN